MSKDQTFRVVSVSEDSLFYYDKTSRGKIFVTKSIVGCDHRKKQNKNRNLPV